MSYGWSEITVVIIGNDARWMTAVTVVMTSLPFSSCRIFFILVSFVMLATVSVV